jgi:Tol biopolymer transport system component
MKAFRPQKFLPFLTAMLVLAISASACGAPQLTNTPTPLPPPTQGFAQQPTPTESEAQPPPTSTSANSASPTQAAATATRAVPADPFAGLVYDTSEGLFLVARNGDAERLIEHPDTTIAIDATVSPDGSQVVYAAAGDVKDLWLVDLTSGERRNLTNTPERSEFAPQLWPAHPEVIVFESKSSEEPLFGYGHPSLINRDGSDYRVLDPQKGGPIALSADGRTIAFGCCDSPGVLYDWSDGALPLSPGAYGLNIEKLFKPVFSPNSDLLAWISGGNLTTNQYQSAIAIFDRESMQAQLLHIYAPVGGGSFPQYLSWSPDGEWIAFVTYNEPGAPPRQPALWVSRPDGSQEHLIGSGYNPVWSPDGKALAFNRSEGSPPVDLAFAVQAGNWQESQQLAYPGHLNSWIQR